MKHEVILKQLLAEAESNPNTLGFLVFGSVATGTHNDQSSGIKNTIIDGTKVGNMFFTHEILVQSIKAVPYLLYPLANAKLLFDRENTINPLLKKINKYYGEHSEVRNKWINYYRQFKQEKAQFGYEKTTIIDVWNELEKEYTGRSKRPFFNAFYLTNPTIFSLLKRFL